MNQSIVIDRNARCAYRQLSRILHERIIGGEYLPGDQLPGTDELSQQTGLHKNTVKLAFKTLRDQGLVKYRPTVGCIVRDDAPFRTALILPVDYCQSLEVLAGMSEALHDCGRAELLPYKDVEEFRGLLQLIQTENYSGAAVYPEHSEAQAVDSLRASGFPLVQIDNFLKNPAQGCYVDSGIYDAGMLLTEHLINQRRAPVAMVAPSNPAGWKFAEGYRDAHRKKRETAWSYNLKILNAPFDAAGATCDLLSSPK